MALAVTLLGTANWATTNNTNFTVTATPAVNDLIVIVGGFTGNVATPTFSDDNSAGAYTVITSAMKATSADEFYIAIRNALIASAVSTIFTITRSGGTTGGGLSVLKVTGMTLTGSSAARGNGKQENQAAGGTPAPVLSLTPLTGNAVISAVFNATNPAGTTIPASFTDRNNSGYNTPATGERTASRDSGQTNATITWGGTSASAFASLAIELDSSVPTTGLPPYANTLGLDHITLAWPRSNPVQTRRS